LAQTVTSASKSAQALKQPTARASFIRDLKPANIMLTKSALNYGLRSGHARTDDFGTKSGTTVGLIPPRRPMQLRSLHFATSPLTQKGSIVGTFQYLAPEVLQGKEADARSDIFAFGCVLYEMITGRRRLRENRKSACSPRFWKKNPTPSAQPAPMLDRLIRACLAKDPADRLQSAHDAAMDLRWIAESAKDTQPSDSKTTTTRFKRYWSPCSPPRPSLSQP